MFSALFFLRSLISGYKIWKPFIKCFCSYLKNLTTADRVVIKIDQNLFSVGSKECVYLQHLELLSIFMCYIYFKIYGLLSFQANNLRLHAFHLKTGWFASLPLTLALTCSSHWHDQQNCREKIYETLLSRCGKGKGGYNVLVATTITGAFVA